jgi:hypothetical protein
MKLALAFLVFVVATSQVEAQGYGVGMRSCSEFANAYAVNPTAVEDIYFTWRAGFHVRDERRSDRALTTLSAYRGPPGSSS